MGFESLFKKVELPKVEVPKILIELDNKETKEEHREQEGQQNSEPIEEVVKPIKVEESNKARVLREHNMLESNIPINHPYWRMR